MKNSQTDAVIDCLTREMALIQGPPGTGKVGRFYLEFRISANLS